MCMGDSEDSTFALLKQKGAVPRQLWPVIKNQTKGLVPNGGVF
jgi:hypothetical protein